MKKKFLYVILTLVFAVALGGGSVAVLSTANALNRSAVVTDGENVETSETAENITAWTAANSANVKNVTGITNVNGGRYKLYNYSGNVQGVTLPDRKSVV